MDPASFVGPALVLAALLCSLVAGFLLAFAVVAMPGLKNLDDGAFIRAFQEIDGVIQNGQPLFMALWIGSALALLVGTGLGAGLLHGPERLLLLGAAAAYLFGVQLPTLAVNVPLNNRLQALEVGAADEGQLQSARQQFEPRWNRWNALRTVFATLTSVLLLLILFRL